MFDVLELTKAAAGFADSNGIGLGFQRCRKIVLKEIRIYEREVERTSGLCFETSDDYKTTTYSDPTGETAVRNAIRSLIARSVRAENL
ncbi:hypothetical protein WG915_08850 [Corynebacterium sp. H128]|uniref:hypothetical protein n=1 Tax=Corynebacterium sp. H128 TaxID=3133427 RepID=UPI003094DE54